VVTSANGFLSERTAGACSTCSVSPREGSPNVERVGEKRID
jgi:Fe-S cluster biogenesis protein NfuA